MERFFVVFFVFLSFSVSGGRERTHNFIRIAFSVAENEIEWECVFFLCCPAWLSDAYKDLLKLSLLCSKIYLPLNIASGVIFLKCKSHHVSSCPTNCGLQRAWPRTGHLRVLHDWSINEWLHKWKKRIPMWQESIQNPLDVKVTIDQVFLI